MKMVFFSVHAAVLNLISMVCAYVLWNVAVGFKARDFQTLKNSNIPLMSLIAMSKCTLSFSSNAWTMFSALVLTLLALVCAQARSLISVRCGRHRLPVLVLPHWKSSLIKKPRYLLLLLLLFLCFPPFSLPVSTWALPRRGPWMFVVVVFSLSCLYDFWKHFRPCYFLLSRADQHDVLNVVNQEYQGLCGLY